MPNYNITIDSKFDPYSFEDYLKPAMLMQEQHNQAADAYANYLAQSAGMEEALAANPDDIDLLNQYNTYRQTLNALADDLSKNGISRTTRRGAFQAKADYGNIAKMQEAIKTREALIAEQRALQAKDNSIMFDRSAPNFSVKDILSGKSNYASVSRNAITADVQNRLKDWAKSTYLQNQNNPEFMKKYGYIFQEINHGNQLNTIELAKLAEYDGNDPVVNAMRNVVRDTVDKYSSTSSLWDKDAVESMREAAYAGLDSTLGSADWSHMQDIELAEARKRAAETKPSVGAKYIWTNSVAAKNNMDLNGSDDSQIVTATLVNNYMNGDKTKIAKDKTAYNYIRNVNQYLKDFRTTENGPVSDKDKEIAIAMFMNSGFIEKMKTTDAVIPDELIPEKYKEGYNNIVSGALTDSDFDIQDANVWLYNQIKNNVTEADYKKLSNDYADYVNKGAVSSEGAFFYGADRQHVWENIRTLLGGMPDEAAYYKGQDIDGNFVESIDKPNKRFDYKNDLLKDPKNGDFSLKENSEIGIFTDSQNHIVAVIKNGNKAYQFDLTEARNRNFPVNEIDQANYQSALNEVRMARKLKIANDTGKELSESEKRAFEYFRNKYGITSISDIDDEDIKNLGKNAQMIGDNLYNSFFSMLTLSQKNTTITDTNDRYSD